LLGVSASQAGRDHLGGYNRAANPDIVRGERLPGYGINAFARVLYEF
jgi:hypothetical protein